MMVHVQLHPPFFLNARPIPPTPRFPVRKHRIQALAPCKIKMLYRSRIKSPYYPESTMCCRPESQSGLMQQMAMRPASHQGSRCGCHGVKLP